jgi:hypothetical protein
MLPVYAGSLWNAALLILVWYIYAQAALLEQKALSNVCVPTWVFFCRPEGLA